MSVYHKLTALKIQLTPPTPPAAAYLPVVRTGNLISGHIAKQNGTPWVGQLGATMNTAQGKEAARSVAVDLISTLHAAIGDLNNITHIVKLLVLVNSAQGYTEQHLVANGASELLMEVFGPIGAHARSAFGVLVPLGSCVEIELIAEAR
jgi:enamine deaminase RidA (YjgF/YER057c/UK114 family)